LFPLHISRLVMPASEVMVTVPLSKNVQSVPEAMLSAYRRNRRKGREETDCRENDRRGECAPQRTHGLHCRDAMHRVSTPAIVAIAGTPCVERRTPYIVRRRQR
jgi:hypothetical protein